MSENGSKMVQKTTLEYDKSFAESAKSPIPVKKVFSKTSCDARVGDAGFAIGVRCWKMLEDAKDCCASCGVDGVKGGSRFKLILLIVVGFQATPLLRLLRLLRKMSLRF